MSFLSLAFLAALPLAAAPLLLHFFDRRRNVVIEWGAMQFLQEAVTRRTSARRLREWLLLLLRVAALLALIVALARPLISGNWFGTTDSRETIVVVDNSMSMLRLSEGQPVLQQLVTQASDTIAQLRTGDTVRVLLASPYPVWLTPVSLRVDEPTKARLSEQLAELRPTEGSSDLLAALLTAVQADAEPSLQQRKIVLLTDGQSTDWKLNDIPGWRRFQDTLSSADLPTQLEVVELAPSADTANLALDEIRASRLVVGVRQPVEVTARIQNYARESSVAGRFAWQVNGELQEAGEFPAIGGGDTRDLLWKHAFPRTGVYAISCRLDADDPLPPDNQATVVVEVIDRIPILLVEGAGHLAEIQRDAYFVQAALGRIEGEDDGDWRAVFEPDTISPERLETIDFAGYRAVVIPNMTELTAAAVERLQTFVSDGGGLWLALGPRTDLDFFNQHFFRDGDGLAPLRISAAVAELAGDPEQSATKINPFAQKHPAVAELADVQRLDTGDVKITGRYRFDAGLSYEDVSVLLDLTNGEPLAVEKHVGRGRVIVQGIPLRYQWSDLALSQSFVVMVHDWLNYLCQPRATRHNLVPGDPIAVHLNDALFKDATLTTPHGDELELASEPAGDGVVFRSSRTLLPGNYSLELGLSGERIPFYVARDSRESNLAGLASVDRRLLNETTGLTSNSPNRRLSGSDEREPLWPILLLALLAVMAGELLLAGVIARHRFGADRIAETTEDWMQQAGNVANIRQPQAPPSELVGAVRGAGETTQEALHH